jgi:hypothetical protein
MAAKRSVEARFRKWHVSEEATIEAPHMDTRVHDAMTHTGLYVEAQVRKAWNNPVIGLAIF